MKQLLVLTIKHWYSISLCQKLCWGWKDSIKWSTVRQKTWWPMDWPKHWDPTDITDWPSQWQWVCGRTKRMKIERLKVLRSACFVAFSCVLVGICEYCEICWIHCAKSGLVTSIPYILSDSLRHLLLWNSEMRKFGMFAPVRPQPVIGLWNKWHKEIQLIE